MATDLKDTTQNPESDGPKSYWNPQLDSAQLRFDWLTFVLHTQPLLVWENRDGPRIEGVFKQAKCN
jgi:hypothetical protein